MIRKGEGKCLSLFYVLQRLIGLFDVNADAMHHPVIEPKETLAQEKHKHEASDDCSYCGFFLHGIYEVEVFDGTNHYCTGGWGLQAQFLFYFRG